MITFLRFLFLISLSFWLGSIFFFSFATAPSVFAVLSKEQAGSLIAFIFDKYYMIQYILAAVSVFSLSLLLLMQKTTCYGTRLIRLGLIIAMLFMTLFSGVYIRNSAVEAKSNMKSLERRTELYKKAEKQFKSSHRNSVIINGLVFLMGIVILFDIARKNEL